MKYLFVVAHPDDEVLGGGATIHKRVIAGDTVDVCIICGYAEARSNRPETDKLKEDIGLSQAALGVNNVRAGSFRDSSLNVYPHQDIVQFIERSILELGSEVIITHHPADLHSDHQKVSQCCQEAARLFQRQTTTAPALKQLLFMDVLSSTDWQLNRSVQPFFPNLFVEVGEEGIAKKIEALSQYKGVMREPPHPRSEQGIKSLSIHRGCQAGMMYAEAFEIAFMASL